MSRHERQDARSARVHSGAGLLDVALQELLEHSADERHGAHGARARLPQLWVHAAPLGAAMTGLRRWGQWGYPRRECERRPEPCGLAGCSRHDWAL